MSMVLSSSLFAYDLSCWFDKRYSCLSIRGALTGLIRARTLQQELVPFRSLPF